jgi:hypothetical protein
MSEYRNRTTGEVKTQGQWRAANPNMSLPRVWKAATLDALNLDPVLRSPAATVGAYQVSVRDGVEQDANGNWVEKYVARDMFVDDAELGTKAEQEAAYQATLDAATAETNRATRDAKLAETDFYALTDVTLTAEMTTYRQALRDITTHANWPNLNDDDWPTKP